MKITKKIGIILVGIILALAGYIAWWISGHNYGHSQEQSLRNIKWCIILYIQLNNGEFPKSEKDLIDKGFLKVIKIEGPRENSYKLLVDPIDRPNGGKFWNSNTFFRIFPIKYGITLDQLDSFNKKLYNTLFNKALYGTKGNEPVLLIDGPYRGLHSTYEEVSYSWYEEMERMKWLSDIGVIK